MLALLASQLRVLCLFFFSCLIAFDEVRSLSGFENRRDDISDSVILCEGPFFYVKTFLMERRIKGTGKKSKTMSLAEEWEGGGDI